MTMVKNFFRDGFAFDLVRMHHDHVSPLWSQDSCHQARQNQLCTRVGYCPLPHLLDILVHRNTSCADQQLQYPILYNVDLQLHPPLCIFQNHHLPVLDGKGLCCHRHWVDEVELQGQSRGEGGGQFIMMKPLYLLLVHWGGGKTPPW